MNIFFLSLFVKDCARMHCLVHVRKMIIEYAQLLSTAHRIIDGKEEIKIIKGKRIKSFELPGEYYKATHINHPCAIWVRESPLHYIYLYELFVQLCKEYTRIYGKVHLTEKKLINTLKNIPIGLKSIKPVFKSFPKAMPMLCREDSVIESYRKYYRLYKVNIVEWYEDEIPEWFG